ncbi:MAG: alpha/beta hydrolase family protein [Woeseiaceae bacterium]
MSRTRKSVLRRLRIAAFYFVLLVVVTITLSLTWLRWESSQPRDEWFVDRQGEIETVKTEDAYNDQGQLAESVRLVSSSGLEVSFRILRASDIKEPLPVLMILGGHRTGSRVVELFSDVETRSVVGVEYPYDGPDKVKGAIPIAKTTPKVRRAFLDTVPAVSLVLDWLLEQPWVDKNRIILVGASLGVPFAATAAARDDRFTGLMLVHGAADNRLWIEMQIARRIDAEYLHYPLSIVLHWMAYGSVLDTPAHVASIAPRPVLIVGAREDERTPAGQELLLFELAGEPRRLRYTNGQHVEPDREDILMELWNILQEEQPFLTQAATP